MKGPQILWKLVTVEHFDFVFRIPGNINLWIYH